MLNDNWTSVFISSLSGTAAISILDVHTLISAAAKIADEAEAEMQRRYELQPKPPATPTPGPSIPRPYI